MQGFGCEYCHRVSGHHHMCPNYEIPETNCYCHKCGEMINVGDEYIVNDNEEYAHWECVDYGRDLANFLGYEIKEMENENIE